MQTRQFSGIRKPYELIKAGRRPTEAFWSLCSPVGHSFSFLVELVEKTVVEEDGKGKEDEVEIDNDEWLNTE